VWVRGADRLGVEPSLVECEWGVEPCILGVEPSYRLRVASGAIDCKWIRLPVACGAD
jgi:hypothetical protein